MKFILIMAVYFASYASIASTMISNENDFWQYYSSAKPEMRLQFIDDQWTNVMSGSKSYSGQLKKTLPSLYEDTCKKVRQKCIQLPQTILNFCSGKSALRFEEVKPMLNVWKETQLNETSFSSSWNKLSKCSKAVSPEQASLAFYLFSHAFEKRWSGIVARIQTWVAKKLNLGLGARKILVKNWSQIVSQSLSGPIQDATAAVALVDAAKPLLNGELIWFEKAAYSYFTVGRNKDLQKLAESYLPRILSEKKSELAELYLGYQCAYLLALGKIDDCEKLINKMASVLAPFTMAISKAKLLFARGEFRKVLIMLSTERLIKFREFSMRQNSLRPLRAEAASWVGNFELALAEVQAHMRLSTRSPLSPLWGQVSKIGILRRSGRISESRELLSESIEIAARHIKGPNRLLWTLKFEEILLRAAAGEQSSLKKKLTAWQRDTREIDILGTTQIAVRILLKEIEGQSGTADLKRYEAIMGKNHPAVLDLVSALTLRKMNSASDVLQKKEGGLRPLWAPSAGLYEF